MRTRQVCQWVWAPRHSSCLGTELVKASVAFARCLGSLTGMTPTPITGKSALTSIQPSPNTPVGLGIKLRISRFLLRCCIGFLLACISIACWSIESPPLPIVRVIDGDTVVVSMNGADTHIRLLYIDTPEVHDNDHGQGMLEGQFAAEAAKVLLPPGTIVRLWSPKDQFEKDRYQRTLAVVLLGPTGGDSLEERMIRGGWSVYWTQYGHAPLWVENRYRIAENSARTDVAGAWRTNRPWMLKKDSETTPDSIPKSDEERAQMKAAATTEVKAWFDAYFNPLAPDKQAAIRDRINANIDFIVAYESVMGIAKSEPKTEQEFESDKKLKETDILQWQAIHGDSSAQLNMSSRFMFDPKQDKEYLRWLKMSAENGNVAGMFQMGMRESQMGSPHFNGPKAVEWLTKANESGIKLAEQGDAFAMYILGRIYSECGIYTRHDPVISNMWFDLAGLYGDHAINIQIPMTPEQQESEKTLVQEWVASHPYLNQLIKKGIQDAIHGTSKQNNHLHDPLTIDVQDQAIVDTARFLEKIIEVKIILPKQAIESSHGITMAYNSVYASRVLDELARQSHTTWTESGGIVTFILAK